MFDNFRRFARMLRHAGWIALCLALASCGPSPPTNVAVPSPPSNVAVPSPTPEPAPRVEPTPPAESAQRSETSSPATTPPAPTELVLPSLEVPAGPLYFCAVATAREPIELDSRVDALCRRHPEMGPCQYEREACRHRGGVVFTARGEEVTPAVEAEYDKTVRRVRLRGD